MTCPRCKGRFKNPKQVPKRCSEYCCKGKLPVASNCATCNGMMKACTDCILIWTGDEKEEDLLRSGYQLAPCTNCQGRGEVMETCTANYHLAKADRIPSTCVCCGGTYDEPRPLKYPCLHYELQGTRPCGRGTGGRGPCFLGQSICPYCDGTGIDGGKFNDCPSCLGTCEQLILCGENWHKKE